ncbi:hypothetical protein [Acidipila sp. EB88]|uniref:hypothetical protein n=1 Tax=Acidipila sp. EB88 TaxID=2305226 RepID=UPI001F2E371F|nr:hypothetical protein [Acidipila sp. EB88]
MRTDGTPVTEESPCAPWITQIAETLIRGLKVSAERIASDEVEAHFGWLAMFVGLDLLASSVTTQQKLNWASTSLGLINDLDAMDYARA